MSDGVSSTTARGDRGRDRPNGPRRGPGRRHRGLHPAAVPGRGRRGRLPAARRRRAHRPRRARASARSSTAGVVTQVRARHEGASFGSDVFLIADGVLPGPPAGDRRGHHHPGRAGVLRPAAPGDARRPRVGRWTATRRSTSTRWTPSSRSGMGRDGEPIYLNLEFLDGTRGAHVSISGISGVATKTSFALFLLHSLFTSGVLGKRQLSTPGADLLGQGRGPAVPRPAQRPAGRRPARRLRAPSACRPRRSPRSGSSPRPCPDDQTGRPNVTGRTSGVSAFWWTLAEFCRDELLPYVFADVEDERNQYTMVVHQVADPAGPRRAAGRSRRRRVRSTAGSPGPGRSWST